MQVAEPGRDRVARLQARVQPARRQPVPQAVRVILVAADHLADALAIEAERIVAQNGASSCSESQASATCSSSVDGSWSRNAALFPPLAWPLVTRPRTMPPTFSRSTRTMAAW